MFHTYKQYDTADCGVACLRMVARHYGKRYSEREIASMCHPTRSGVSLLDISEAATQIGLRSVGVRLSAHDLATRAKLPCILHWNGHHFVVCHKITRQRSRLLFHIADPASKQLVYNEEEFENCWSSGKDNNATGVALLLEPTADFYHRQPQRAHTDSSAAFILRYFAQHRRSLATVLLAMLIVSLLQLTAPYLTQALVDVGIGRHSTEIIRLILVAQLTILFSSVVVGMIRNWVTLYMNTRINITLVSDFLIKIMRMPLRFFDTKHTGDIIQRMRDNDRIEEFLTGSSVATLFSMLNFAVFAIILAFYDLTILLTFVVGNAMYVAWTQCLMSCRRDLDIKRFNQLADEQDITLQIIHGIRDIKLANCERQKLWEWERLQARIFGIKQQTLTIAQLQQFGSILFCQTTSIVITYISASKVVDGSLTVGSMMAIAYIIGQITMPVSSFVDFLCSLQYARLSLDRLSELHNSSDEGDSACANQHTVPSNHTITFKNVCFGYSGSERRHVLHDINLSIPSGKVTAVVGASGCGKTTLLKMILGFYRPDRGDIYVGDTPITDIDKRQWRNATGSVLQDGYIFSTDIAHNIALGDDNVDSERLIAAAKTACIYDFVMQTPLGFDTKVGTDGMGLSQGQKQRLLIARAVYKSPTILILDEATNALDSKTENDIIRNLHTFYQGRTVVVAAHRLSTIRRADNIVVVSDGTIVEQGTHSQLIERKGEYYSLVANQICT